ncbi:MAG TPA: hypothetical protein VFU10_02405 [Gaiellaceae bacterium]|nr:hypothetical protein [Gaiellaceae bacterium]
MDPGRGDAARGARVLLLLGAVVSALFALLVFCQPTKNIHLGFITYPPNFSALTSLISFSVSGIYLAFLMTVIAAIVARARLGAGRIVPALALGLVGLHLGRRVPQPILLNIVAPSGLDSALGALFNLDWITLLVIAIIAAVGALYFFSARPDRAVSTHLHDELEATGAERQGISPT